MKDYTYVVSGSFKDGRTLTVVIDNSTRETMKIVEQRMIDGCNEIAISKTL